MARSLDYASRSRESYQKGKNNGRFKRKYYLDLNHIKKKNEEALKGSGDGSKSPKVVKINMKFLSQKMLDEETESSERNMIHNTHKAMAILKNNSLERNKKSRDRLKSLTKKKYPSPKNIATGHPFLQPKLSDEVARVLTKALKGEKPSKKFSLDKFLKKSCRVSYQTYSPIKFKDLRKKMPYSRRFVESEGNRDSRLMKNLVPNPNAFYARMTYQRHRIRTAKQSKRDAYSVRTRQEDLNLFGIGGFSKSLYR